MARSLIKVHGKDCEKVHGKVFEKVHGEDCEKVLDKVFDKSTWQGL